MPSANCKVHCLEPPDTASEAFVLWPFVRGENAGITWGGGEEGRVAWSSVSRSKDGMVGESGRSTASKMSTECAVSPMLAASMLIEGWGDNVVGATPVDDATAASQASTMEATWSANSRFSKRSEGCTRMESINHYQSRMLVRDIH